jgi:hypothetical protein
MYVRLYFPKLSKIHQTLFRAQGKLNKLKWLILTDNPPSQSEIITASGEVSHLLRLMEQELIDNRDVLLEDHSFLKRYKVTSKEAMENITPPPEGPVFSPSYKAAPADACFDRDG